MKLLENTERGFLQIKMVGATISNYWISTTTGLVLVYCNVVNVYLHLLQINNLEIFLEFYG